MAKDSRPEIGSLGGRTPHADVIVRPAASQDELEQAFRLVYRTYLQRGYIAPHQSKIRLSAFNAFPDTATFTGVLDDRVIATISLVPDTPVGLPMDEIYHDELQALRDNGRRVSEVTMLADRRMEMRRTLPMLLSLMKFVFDYATLVLKATDLCITVNPRHQTFYRRYLLFGDLGDLRSYPSVRDNPAVAKRLDLQTVRKLCENHQLLLRLFFENRTPVKTFEDRYRMDCKALHYFFVEKTSLFRQAKPHVLAALEDCRPDCPWREWVGPAAHDRAEDG